MAWLAGYRTNRVPWDRGGPYGRDWSTAKRELGEACAAVVARARATPTVIPSAELARLVLGANRMEGVLGRVDDATALRWMDRRRDGADDRADDDDNGAWAADGSRDPVCTRRQLRRSLEAATYLLVDHACAPLTAALVRGTHELLMRGALPEPGALRRRPVNAGLHRFPDHRLVAGSLDWLAADYRETETTGHPIARATALLYDLLTLHPFDDGNGRLARLFFAWSLARDGLPMAVSLSSGHRRRRQHYMHAIRTARRTDVEHASLGELNCIAHVSIERALADAAEPNK
jgi:fido (protein-threonine AMPylation protein)